MNVASQQMQTKLHRLHVAFTLDPIFFVASCCEIASPLLALLYRSFLHWRVPLPCRFSIALERPQILHQASRVIGIHPILSFFFLQLSPATAESCGRHWDARYMRMNVKTAFEMYYFRSHWEEQRYRCNNNRQQWVSNRFERHEQQAQRV